MISKKEQLNIQSEEFLAKAKVQKKKGKKTECQYFLKKKILNDTLNQKLTGKITMINKEGHLPYDRTILNKNLFGSKAENLKIRKKLINLFLKLLHQEEYTQLNPDPRPE